MKQLSRPEFLALSAIVSLGTLSRHMVQIAPYFVALTSSLNVLDLIAYNSKPCLDNPSESFTY